jgi:hypothetical protein
MFALACRRDAHLRLSDVCASVPRSSTRRKATRAAPPSSRPSTHARAASCRLTTWCRRPRRLRRRTTAPASASARCRPRTCTAAAAACCWACWRSASLRSHRRHASWATGGSGARVCARLHAHAAHTRGCCVRNDSDHTSRCCLGACACACPQVVGGGPPRALHRALRHRPLQPAVPAHLHGARAALYRPAADA